MTQRTSDDDRGVPGSYSTVYQASLNDPEAFWTEAARDIEWFVAPRSALRTTSAPFAQWFADASLNTSFNALDRHVANGDGERTALIYDSPVTETVRKYSYDELLDQVARCAGALRGLGVVKGDRVLIYMPMIPETVVTMLACARLGAVHAVVFGGFAAPELATRIDDCRPKVIVSASCGIERDRIVPYKPILDAAIDLAEHGFLSTVVVQREMEPATLRPGDRPWDDLMKDADPAGCVPVASSDPLYILYTSGTTGRPKGIVRDNGGHAVALRWSMRAIYDAAPTDVFWAASDLGWVVGHSYIVYGPLLAGCTTLLYEGKPIGTPDASAYWRVVEQHRVNILFTAPTALRAIRREDPDAKGLTDRETSSLRTIFLAGERADPDTLEWAQKTAGVPVVDHWWQTETGWASAANCLGLERMPIKPGSATVPVPGYDVEVLDDDGAPLPAGDEGSIVVRLPLPPGCLLTVWNDDRRFIDNYLRRFPGFYDTGDGGYIDEDGYLFVLGRLDDVINVAAHRLATGQIEGVVAEHPDVAECAVVGVSDQIKGEVPRAFVVLRDSPAPSPTVADEIKSAVRAGIGPIAALSAVDIVPALPKTRSGKVLRRTLRDLIERDDVDPPSTIEDPSVLDGIRDAIHSPPVDTE